MTLPVLVVEDNVELQEAVLITLELAGFTVLTAADGEEALTVLCKEPVGLIVSDGQMEPMDGYALFKKVRQDYPNIPFVMMTAYAQIEKAVDLIRGGALHYMQKPFEPEALVSIVKQSVLNISEQSDDDMVVASQAMKRLMSIARKVAPSDATVLITGPSGTGKEVLSRFIHQVSLRHDGPFIAVNCAAIPDHLLESTLFGHEKGAFTGASSALAGKFEQANGGTILLDEISEMPLALQAKLLRVLQEREVERLGSTKTIALNIRVIATSNRDMRSMVDAGDFREDLYFRLNVFPLQIPALSERVEDILPLARKLLSKYSLQVNKVFLSLSPGAEACLIRYHWGGNIRELDNVMQRAAILAVGSEVLAEDLMLDIDDLSVKLDAPELNVVVKSQPKEDDLDIRQLEKRHILETLSAVGGVRKLAAKKLGMSERTLRYKLQRYREEGCDI